MAQANALGKAKSDVARTVNTVAKPFNALSQALGGKTFTMSTADGATTRPSDSAVAGKIALYRQKMMARGLKGAELEAAVETVRKNWSK